MDLSQVTHLKPLHDCAFSPAEEPKTTRTAFSSNSNSICFEAISECLFDIFAKAWEFLKCFFCCGQSDIAKVSEPEIVYQPAPESTLWFNGVEIEGKKFEVVLDTGCRHILVLQEKSLEKIRNKTLAEKQSITDCTGKAILANRYKVPEAHLAGVSFKEVIIAEYDLTKLANCGGVDGVIGLPFFEETGSFFVDFSNKNMLNHEWGDVNEIVELGYALDSFVEIPLQKSQGGLLTLQIKTDFGRLTFILDTASTVSMIRPSLINFQNQEKMTPENMPFYTSSTFKIGSKDFGSTSLALIGIDPKIAHDGILGMDFLQNYAFDLDVLHLTLKIGDSLKKGS